jgi:hypothetical protein
MYQVVCGASMAANHESCLRSMMGGQKVRNPSLAHFSYIMPPSAIHIQKRAAQREKTAPAHLQTLPNAFLPHHRRPYVLPPPPLPYISESGLYAGGRAHGSYPGGAYGAVGSGMSSGGYGAVPPMSCLTRLASRFTSDMTHPTRAHTRSRTWAHTHN